MSENTRMRSPKLTLSAMVALKRDHHGHIEQVDPQTEMQRSYLDYAMAVIIGRAPCRMCDGSARAPPRNYAMYDGGYRPDRSFNKCARVVGDVMGQFHPHGDSAIYDTLVRLIQSWIRRYPLARVRVTWLPGNDGAAASIHRDPRWPHCPEMVRHQRRHR